MADNRSDEEFLEDAIKRLSPLWVLNRVAAEATRYPLNSVNDRPLTAVSLAHTSGVFSSTAQERAIMQSQGQLRYKLLYENVGTRAALDRLIAIGAQPVLSEEQEPGWCAVVLQLIVPFEALPALHELAAESAGIFGHLERLNAITSYRRWLLQSYCSDWKSQCRNADALEQNPYLTARNDFGRDPDPDRADVPT